MAYYKIKHMDVCVCVFDSEMFFKLFTVINISFLNDFLCGERFSKFDSIIFIGWVDISSPKVKITFQKMEPQLPYL